MALTGQFSIASLTQRIFELSCSFLTTALSQDILKTFGQTETQFPHPIHTFLFIFIIFEK